MLKILSVQWSEQPIGAIAEKVPYGDKMIDLGVALSKQFLMPGSGRKRSTFKGKSFRP